MILNGECGVFQPLLLECLVESSDIIQQEMAVDAVVRGDQRIMENTAVEVLQHGELNTTDRTLRALEFERAKLRFFMSASQDILFECTKNPSVLTLCHAGTQRLGLEKDMVDPCHDPRVLKMIGMEHIQELARRLQSTTPEKPAVEYRCEVLLDGVMTPVRLMCQAMWSAEEPPQYAGVVGKMIEERREEERH